MSGDEGNISNQGDLLTVLKSNGATQTGAFAALVATIVQPFAQDSMIEALNLCDSFAIYLEIALCFLLSIYSVYYVQKVRVVERIIIVVLSTFIIFSTAVGANNIVVPKKKDVMSIDIVNNLKEQIDEQNKLLKELGVEPVVLQKDNKQSSIYTNFIHNIYSKLMKNIVGSAYAQGDIENTKNKTRAIEDHRKEAIKRYQLKQNKLIKIGEMLKRKEEQKNLKQQLIKGL
jgi:hypothetical protein